MIAARQWPEDKPLPDPESFLARDLLDPTLKEMGYVPTNIETPAKGNWYSHALPPRGAERQK
jgi:hypothetical protein